MRNVPLILLVATLGACLAPTPIDGQIPYAIDLPAYWQEGCLPPCLCPILFSDDLTGTFTRTFTGYDGDTQLHAIDDIEFSLNQAPGVVTGTGLWRADDALGLQRLELDVVIEGALRSFDSDWVPWVPVAPDQVELLEIAVAENGFYCYDTVFGIVASPADVPFRRGDCNVDGTRDIADVIHLLGSLFTGGVAVECRDACDANDDGSMNIADAVSALASLFAGAGPLPEPFDLCGPDPTADAVGCETFGACP